MQQGSDVPLDGAVAHELVPNEIRIVRGRDVILRQRPRHIVVYPSMLVHKRGVVRRQKERCESLLREYRMGVGRVRPLLPIALTLIECDIDRDLRRLIAVAVVGVRARSVAGPDALELGDAEGRLIKCA